MIRITKIRVRYRLQIPAGTREKAERALEIYPGICPAYASVKGCISVESTAELTEK